MQPDSTLLLLSEHRQLAWKRDRFRAAFPWPYGAGSSSEAATAARVWLQRTRPWHWNPNYMSWKSHFV